MGRAREAAGLSGAQAARRLGVKTATWQGWENDRAEPRSNKLLMIAGAFGVSPTWLLGGYGDGPTEVIEDEVQILRQALKSVAQDVAAAPTRLDAALSRVENFQPYYQVQRTCQPFAARVVAFVGDGIGHRSADLRCPGLG